MPLNQSVGSSSERRIAMDGTFTAALFVVGVAIVLTLFYRNRRAKLASLPKADDTTEVGHGKKGMDSQKELIPLAPLVSIGRKVVIGVWIAAVALVGLSSVEQVSTKNVGAVTAFGQPVGSFDNGLHPKLPWYVVTELDAADQVDTYKGGGDSGGCVTVRIANQATACVDYALKWRLRQDKADEAFQAHRDFAGIKNSMTTSVLPGIGNEVFAGYDPLAVDDKGNFTAPSNVELSKKSTEALAKKSGNRIEVIEVIVSNIALDAETQKQLNNLNAETAKTRTALQAQKTAEAQAEANRILASSLAQNPNVLTAQCFELYKLAIDRGQQLPVAGMTGCWNSPTSTMALLGNSPNKPS